MFIILFSHLRLELSRYIFVRIYRQIFYAAFHFTCNNIVFSCLCKQNAINIFGRSEGAAQYIVDLCTTPKLATSCDLVRSSFTRKARGTSGVRKWTNPRTDGTPRSGAGQTSDLTAPPVQGARQNTDVIMGNRRSVKCLFLPGNVILWPINILWAFRETFCNVCFEQSELDALGYMKRLTK